MTNRAIKRCKKTPSKDVNYSYFNFFCFLIVLERLSYDYLLNNTIGGNMNDIANLLERYSKGNCTADEKFYVETWLDAHQIENNQWVNLPEEGKQALLSSLFEDINSEIAQRERKTVTLWLQSPPNWTRRIAVAVAAVAAITLGVYFYNAPGPVINRNSEIVEQNDIAPGKNGATLTLSNGKVISLSEAHSGIVIGEDKLAYNDGTEILRSTLNDKKLDDKGGVLSSRVSRDLVASTAKGQMYTFRLPDGTKVWLNADSKISFAQPFVKKSRQVFLDGEAYFEVAKNKAVPFIVNSDHQVVEVLGTHFNINSYKDEARIITTLVEGSIKLKDGKLERLLRPNDQALNDGKSIVVAAIDVNEAMAWKEGYFRFNDEKMSSIVKELERWYDVDIELNEGLSDLRFTGKISRSRGISSVLSLMKETNQIKFEIEGRRVRIIAK